jgi:hypothetical protein
MPSARPAQHRSAAETLQKAFEPIGDQPACCEFDRERIAIESTADLGRGSGMIVVQLLHIPAGDRMGKPFSTGTQCLTACRDEMYLRGMLKEHSRNFRRRVDKHVRSNQR